MNRGIRLNDPLVLAAFHSSLLTQLLVIFAVVVVLSLAWNLARSVQFRRAAASGDLLEATDGEAAPPEPRARLVLRLLFGALWTFDGLLQLQPAMPLGLPSGVLSPAAGGAPGWVQHVVNFGVTIWSNHPIIAATSAVWIQIGVGIGLLVAPRGWWSRSAGLATVGWGLVVWVFGEAVGGLFTPGASWLFGLPGAALYYVVAGLLIALPEAAWRSGAIGRWMLRGLGALFVAMAVLQAWPGRGTWNGAATAHTAENPLAAMASAMSGAPQPSPLAAAIRSFAAFDAQHGFGVNLVIVLLLLGVGTCLLTGHRRIAGVGVVVGIVVCLADWVLVQDYGFFGGVGTDPNSMVPTAFLLGTGYLAMVPATAVTPSVAADAARDGARARSGWRGWTPAYLLQVAGAVLAGAIVVIGAAPMALAAANPRADPILTEAVNGSPNHVDFPAWSFSLTDQHGRHVALDELRGRVVVLTFLDPLCSSDCPLIAQQLRNADAQLGDAASCVTLVAIDANPTYLARSALVAFDRQEQLTTLRNWEFVTGPLDQLNALWIDYGVSVAKGVDGVMALHSDLIYVIDRAGAVRSVIQSDPGNTTATASSLSTLVAAEVQRVLAL
ncbi:MAG TPA: SCO family protein [Acidimicrobiales bacterium]|nr:SCO family protein [Acidimicrobiales bacterium]